MSKINLQESKRLRKIEFWKDRNPLASRADLRTFMASLPEEKKQFLFYYIVFTHVQDDQYKTVTENDVKELLKNDIEIHYLTVEKSPDRLPEVLKGHKVIRENIDSTEHLAEYILMISGVLPNESDLRLPQYKQQSEKVPLVAKLRSFNKSQADQKFWDKWGEETRQRFLACLQSGKSEAECKKDCTIRSPKVSIKPKIKK
jgi:hypothetical protein